MKIRNDWHIHSEHSYDSACLKMEDLVTGAEKMGIREYAVTDHLNTSENHPDIENSRKAYDAILTKNPGLKGTFHFGVEVDCIPRWKLAMSERGEFKRGTPTPDNCKPEDYMPGIAIDREYIRKNGIELVVGGAHSPSFRYTEQMKLIEDYHRQNIFLALNEHIDILAHWLWWYPVDYAANPFDDFDKIPASMKRELGQALIEGNCAFELSQNAILCNNIYPQKFKRQYLEYVAELQSMGVVISFCTDSHRPDYTAENFEINDELIRGSGFNPEKNIFTSKNLGKR